MAVQLKRYDPDNKYYVIAELTSVITDGYWSHLPKGASETDHLVFAFDHLPTETEILEKVESTTEFKIVMRSTERIETVKVTGYTIIAPMERKEIVFR